MTRKLKELVREGKYAAEVSVELVGGVKLAWGTPEDIVKAPRAIPGKFLEPVLERAGKPRRRGGGANDAAERAPCSGSDN